MDLISLEWLENILKTKSFVLKKNILINGISIDTRTLKKGSLFIAIKGEKFDGHNFIQNASLHGASGAIVDQNFVVPENIPDNFFIIKVANTIKALQEISKAYRQKFNLVMVNITGSNGKTTTKDMIHSILSTSMKTYKSEGNFNNELGVPLSLMSITADYEAAVLELGMTHKGDINLLIDLTNPKIRVLTNVGPAHLQNFSSVMDIAMAKGEIFDNMHSEDIAIINADDIFTKNIGDRLRSEKIFFGVNSEAQITATEIKSNSFDLIISAPYKYRTKINLPLIGKHNVYNALAAAAVGITMNIAPEKIAQGLSSFIPTPGRMELCKLNDSIWVINDAYNANPLSMKSAIETFSDQASDRQKILILGDMLELGHDEINFHKEIGKQLVNSGVKYLFTYGNLACYIAEGAIGNGMKENQIFICSSHEEIENNLIKVLTGNDIILLKGSRAMKMEKILEFLKSTFNNGEN
ncbi:UDP-N-acetylmuramoyl-tripeptide--D-alanyl-D-alanine ligase [Candidatus Poribacteria bacterium]|nr:UDP-N-acetylmuramoyl-tripeptide--D-alanyl-D-alanine ligase [Candidatus Poribacteria bacterium]